MSGVFRLLADENFNGDIVRGLLFREPNLDLLRVQDVGLGGADDPTVVAWSADHDRIVLTHDRATMPGHAHDRVLNREAMAGVFVLSDRLPIGKGIEEILLVIQCSEPPEWHGRVVFLPL